MLDICDDVQRRYDFAEIVDLWGDEEDGDANRHTQAYNTQLEGAAVWQSHGNKTKTHLWLKHIDNISIK